jgi:phosphonoacetaldehyde hydrolase
MSNRIKAVVFDWAGTMIDFGSCAPVEAMTAAFAQAGINISAAQVRRDMGRAKRDHVEAILLSPEVVIAWQAAHRTHPTTADGDRIYAALEPLMAESAARHTVLIPGAAEIATSLRAAGVKIGSCTGYTREMMAGIIPHAAAQGYAPDYVVCAGETHAGRPSPLMLWKNLVELGAWPAEACVKVDDADVGIAEGINAGCWTVGVAASGNAVGLSYDAFHALDPAERERLTGIAAEELYAAGAHYVIDTVADLQSTLDDISARLARGELPHE